MGTTDELEVVALSSCSGLKREDIPHPKHDSLFKEWKVLAGPSDWEDHSMGKEGAERYRVHNLPDCSSCPGLYELGLADTQAHSGRETGNYLDPLLTKPVYVGQTDNIRTRLQQYGRDGAHLEIGSSNGQQHQLFSDAFSRDYSVLYRWAPMKNKEAAKKMEAQLLETYDYPWNKGNNCVRRNGDIYVKTDTRKSLPWEDGSIIYSDRESNHLFPQIFKSGGSHPRPVTPRNSNSTSQKSVPSRSVLQEDYSSTCEATTAEGNACSRPRPAEGGKRCWQHKLPRGNTGRTHSFTPLSCYGGSSSGICGASTKKGFACRNKVRGNERCWLHTE